MSSTLTRKKVRRYERVAGGRPHIGHTCVVLCERKWRLTTRVIWIGVHTFETLNTIYTKQAPRAEREAALGVISPKETF